MDKLIYYSYRFAIVEHDNILYSPTNIIALERGQKSVKFGLFGVHQAPLNELLETPECLIVPTITIPVQDGPNGLSFAYCKELDTLAVRKDIYY